MASICLSLPWPGVSISWYGVEAREESSFLERYLFEPMGIEGGRLRVTGGDGIWDTRVDALFMISSSPALCSRLSREVLPAPVGPSSTKDGVSEAAFDFV